jgi:two-component system, NtrC family, sensor histidine kinase HydH
MDNKRKYYTIVIGLSILLITLLHYSTYEPFHAMHDIYRQFYLIPLFVGALVFGLRGAMLTYLFMSLLYLPYMVESWTGHLIFETNRALFLLFSAIFSFIAGFLVDRDRRRKEQVEKERYLSGLGRAAATIVHDLKNPLLAIQLSARRIEKGKGDPSVALRAILDSAGVMQSIVRDALDFSKPIQLIRKKEDASGVVRTACDRCMAKAQEKGVALSVDIAKGPLPTFLDGARMQRALVNLINNAIEASGNGQNVIVSAAREKDSLRITIGDAGTGMDRETLKNLFIPFFSTKDTGTGLGMPIARKIIEGHGGTINVDSRLEKGTLVMIELPTR